MKVQTVGSVSEFLHRKEEPFSVKVERHFKKYGVVYKAAGITIILLACGGHVLAAGSIDIEARRLYKELVNIGQWIIAFKGAIDIIKALGEGDVGSAKKTFISALLTFIILKSLPFGMDKVSQIFDKVAY